MIEDRNPFALILMYHRVAEVEDEPDLHELKVEPRHFAAHIQHLRSHYRIVSLPQLAEQLACGNLLHDAQVVITFDDGYVDNYLNAYPVLKDHATAATIFLPTNYIDGRAGLFWWERLRLLLWNARAKEIRLEMIGPHVYSLEPEEHLLDAYFALNDVLVDLRPQSREQLLDQLGKKLDAEVTMSSKALTWTQISEMSAQGVLFGSHTQSHASVAGLSAEEFGEELQQSQLDIELHTGQPVKTFAYPYGHPTSFNEMNKTVLKKMGFACACATTPGCVHSGSDLYALNRLMVKNWSEVEFAAKVREALST
jgi:peptidoglycan/xylan/chitin deacetylase (PgdA/CDA1 family)